VFRLLLSLALVVAGCHHDDPPPAAPKPSSTGTPIGYLLDATTDLQLTDDQTHELRGMDETLKMRLAEIDHDAKPKKPPGSGSGSGSGSSGGLLRPTGGMGGGGMGGHHRGRGAMAANAQPASKSPTTALDQLRADTVRAAIEASLARLGPKQQKRALRVLVDHDVDYDTGSTDEEQIDPPEP